MNYKVFIHTNNKQILGAKLAKYAILKNLEENQKKELGVEIINVDEMDIFEKFKEVPYLRNGVISKYDRNDLQSFTLSRFMPPKLMNYEGISMVIDPDIFAIKNVFDIFKIDFDNKDILACSKKDDFDSSVMVMNNKNLKDWDIELFLYNLKNKKWDYNEIMRISLWKNKVKEIPRKWNSLDELKDETIMLHTTNRLTQPWRTGLKIDFEMYGNNKKILGIIPRTKLFQIIGKAPKKYLGHPDKKIEVFFINLLKNALNDEFINESEIINEVEKLHVRKDIFDILKKTQ